ncbi:MAG: oxygen-dependent protoporphyrinogen oxidase [Piccolia ochrophora]|nr:MAG: oxygen-dependent protoporphyrinogen oxidase [Piccolia ochrophora]
MRPRHLKHATSFAALQKSTSSLSRGHGLQAIQPHRRASSNARKSNSSTGDDVAVLGGGITGLATAFFLLKSSPSTKVTLYEAGSRLGGWLETKHVDVGTGSIVFEQGPRTLRPSVPNGLVTLRLIKELDLEEEVLLTPKSAAAAQNRYVYFPDRLNRMPGPGQPLLQQLMSLAKDPVFAGLVSGFLKEPFRQQRSAELEDESVESFISRRFSPYVARNIVSAVFHGIYAGDIAQLSARSLLPLLWQWEGGIGSVMGAMLEQRFMERPPVPARDLELAEYLGERDVSKENKIFKASVFTFKKGLGALTDALKAALSGLPNFTLRLDSSVQTVKYRSPGMVEVLTGNKETPIQHTHAISTLPFKTLASLIDTELDSPSSLLDVRSVTVMVVNLYYTQPNLLPVHGFGYLIPKSVPFDQNPELALGAVFDSDAVTGQDTATGTKVTVMLGGHWWDDWSDYPDEEEAVGMAKAVLARHLGIHASPAAMHASLQRDCIPQYTVGHHRRMADLHRTLNRHYVGRFRVAGSSFHGVGVNDCLRAAFDAAHFLHREEVKTGLEMYVEDPDYRRIRKGSEQESDHAI